MPVFRGLEISIVASSEAKKLPEYPHPDGSSVRLLSVDNIHRLQGLSPGRSDASILSETDPTRQKKFNPRISVYIASIPGEQFGLRYDILRSPALSTHLYFKMYLNGSLTTSWGISTNQKKSCQSQFPISGTVARALYEPSEKFYDENSGPEWKEIGIETRYFYFMPGLEYNSVANDGGLIEVQIFRSRGRRRRAPEMTEFRSQERYGIASPSGGLMENPQDAAYYDWLLVDPRGAPYATFCFHYRSMKNLVHLNLIPQSDSSMLLSAPEAGVASWNQNASFIDLSSARSSSATGRFVFDVHELDSNATIMAPVGVGSMEVDNYSAGESSSEFEQMSPSGDST
ncbi:hypothetical protein BX600DRAFT_516493 [Xylariales sp. PMI_506]|nr:hypothetical protein BX600DRAFT_516493 [Xylariales sp. PMI_506]